MGLKAFAERTVLLSQGERFSLKNRAYLHAVYESVAANIVIRASRQVEKSTFLVNRIVYDCYRCPGIRILFVSPRREQAHLFSRDRLATTVMAGPILRRLLWQHDSAMPAENIVFDNGSRVYVRSAYHNANAIRGISADELFIDEYQDIAAGELPVLRETLSHAKQPRLILTGTPKSVDNHLEAAMGQSTCNEWQVTCAGCQRVNLMDESVIGPDALRCAACQTVLDARLGRWVARNPDSSWGAGYWVNHAMVPWLNVPEIVNRQREYDPVRFKNEVLGLPTEIGDHLITREEIEGCCENRPFAKSLNDVPVVARQRLVAGLDWGGGGVAATVLVIGYIDDQMVFRVLRFDRWLPGTDPAMVFHDIVQRCQQFRVPFIAADGGGFGLSHNRLLFGQLRDSRQQTQMYSIFYSATDRPPERDGVLWRWTVNRSATIGTLFTRIKRRQLRFPQLGESSSFLGEFLAEIAAYDPEMRSLKFTKPETARDDALHATNYAQVLGIRMWQGMHR